jgi:hypothetical protein
MLEPFREGARSGDPIDRCSACGQVNLLFSMDFKKFGQHRLRACQHCKAVTVDGEKFGDITFTPVA